MGRHHRLRKPKSQHLRVVDITPNKQQLICSGIKPKRRAHNHLQFALKPLRVGAMNVDGLTRQAAHGVETLIHRKGIDIMGISETHYRADMPKERYPFVGFKEWHCDREGKSKWGGGLTILYKDSLQASPYSPTVPPNLEYVSREGLLVSLGSQKVAFLHCYLASKNRENSHIQWNKDLYSLMINEAKQLRQQNFVILSIGDFNARVGQIPGMDGNTPDHNSDTPLFQAFISSLDLLIVNSLPISRGREGVRQYLIMV